MLLQTVGVEHIFTFEAGARIGPAVKSVRGLQALKAVLASARRKVRECLRLAGRGGRREGLGESFNYSLVNFFDLFSFEITSVAELG